jgi:flagella basal body P-ring formation protein FlgA
MRPLRTFAPARPWDRAIAVLKAIRRYTGAALFGLAVVGLILYLAVSAKAAEPSPRLRAEALVAGDLVTIGDLFEDPGPLAGKAIFRAPDLGTTGNVPAWRVMAEARAAGLVGARDGNIVEVVVTRSAREVPGRDIQDAITSELAIALGGLDRNDLDVTFDQPLEPQLADSRSRQPARVTGVSLLAQSRFEATVVIDKGAGQAADRLKLRGRYVETVSTLVLTRALARNEVARAEDLNVVKLPKRQAGTARSTEPSEIVGLAAKRVLRAGQPALAADFSAPLMVGRGDIVTLVYQMPGLMLTTRGQALDQGAIGDLVTVLNQQSKRTVNGVVIGPGRVSITTGSAPAPGRT